SEHANGPRGMHADHGARLRAHWAVDNFQVNHGPAAMRIALHAGLHASLATNTTRLINEKLVIDHARSTLQAHTLYSGIFEIGSSARFVSRLADFFPGQ